ncbi:hypothetical protein JCM18899A_11310 [Nocardioides sp. AN3]
MNGDTRVGDAERERAAAVLGDHYAAGRLDHSEYAERLDAIWTARTRADLDILFHDLPRLAPQAPVRQRRRGGLPFPVAAVLVVLAAILVLTHLPIILLVLGAVLLFKLGRHRSHLCGGPRAPTSTRW